MPSCSLQAGLACLGLLLGPQQLLLHHHLIGQPSGCHAVPTLRATPHTSVSSPSAHNTHTHTHTHRHTHTNTHTCAQKQMVLRVSSMRCASCTEAIECPRTSSGIPKSTSSAVCQPIFPTCPKPSHCHLAFVLSKWLNLDLPSVVFFSIAGL